MSDVESNIRIFPYARGKNSHKSVVYYFFSFCQLLFVFSVFISPAFCEDLSIVNDPTLNCKIDFYFCLGNDPASVNFLEKTILFTRNISDKRYRFIDMLGTVGSSGNYDENKFHFVERNTKVEIPSVEMKTPEDTRKCVESVIKLTEAKENFQASPPNIRAIYIRMEKEEEHPDIYKSIVENNFHPLILTKTKTDEFFKRTYFYNLCYHRTKERKCENTPIVPHGNQASLEKCKNTLMLQNCPFECDEGYTSRYLTVFCSYANRWLHDISIRDIDRVTCETKNDVCTYDPKKLGGVETFSCRGKKVDSVCIPNCPPGFKRTGDDFICRFNRSRNFAYWEGSSTCVEVKKTPEKNGLYEDLTVITDSNDVEDYNSAYTTNPETDKPNKQKIKNPERNSTLETLYKESNNLDAEFLSEYVSVQNTEPNRKLELFKSPDASSEESNLDWTCSPITCSSVAEPSSINLIDCSGFDFGDECRVVCQKPYLKVGGNAICSEDGEWLIQSACESKLKVAAAIVSVFVSLGLVLLSLWALYSVWRSIN